EPSFRAKQIFVWLHQKRVSTFSEMTNLPKTLQETLSQSCTIDTLEVAKKQVSSDGTIKYLFRLSDGNCIESVVMKYDYGVSICISTQVGCRMGCKFCASTQAGRVRDLTAGEIAAEVYTAQKDCEERISHIVLMGIGEPLDNYDNVVDFLSIISDDDGINIGMRNISLSTCGIVPQIEKLALLHLGVTLSVSLHAPNDELRSSMMPINNKYKIGQLIPACRNYQRVTGRRISFEYSLVKGVNDSDREAFQLAHLIKGMGAHVNLIPINPVDGSPYSATDAKNVENFKEKLVTLGVNATVRRRLGQDISAACGQLRREEMTT
ncbi:MAG: 23S rRNA (adenine(2503)-C(2))-methyltransferase RlmN, partial [Oscillospiraceae bacterium]